MRVRGENLVARRDALELGDRVGVAAELDERGREIADCLRLRLFGRDRATKMRDGGFAIGGGAIGLLQQRPPRVVLGGSVGLRE